MAQTFILKDISYLDSTSMKLSQGDIRITNGLITDISTELKINQDEIVIHSENTIVFPGLVNAHLHPSKEIYGSILDSSPIDVVLDTVHKNNALEDSVGQYVASLKSLTAGLKKGVTLFGLFTSRIESDVRAASQAGIRCAINFCQSNQWVGSGKSPENKSAEKILREYLDAEKKYQSDLITFSPSTASELSADDALLLKLHQLASNKKKKLTLHIHEGKHQVSSHQKAYGMSGIERLASLKILDEHTTLIHSCHLSVTDLTILQSTKCNIIHCPVSNSFVGAGTLPLRSLLPEITVGLGTDAAMVNPSNDLTFDALFTLYHHGDDNFSRKIDAASVLYMLTEGGAKALGIKNVGRIENGFKADLIFFDKTHIDTDYINTPVSLLKMLNHEKPQQVMVNGETIISNGRLVNPVLDNNKLEFSAIRRKLKA
ncbi:amidohydrolase family protein [Xenorhabdus nematophila]|uniref:amidohydrolase family protein n=1 Tax=Xenorhabdus nematophila TaxID=628 RepID=UPI0032B80C9E